MNRFGVAIAGVVLAVASASAVAQQGGDRSRDRSYGDAQDEVRETQGSEEEKQPAQQDGDRGGRRDGGDPGQQANRSSGSQDWRGGDRDGDDNRGNWNGNGDGNRDGRNGDRYGHDGGNDDRRHDNKGSRYGRDDHRNGNWNGNRGHRDGRYAYYSHGKGYGYNRWRAPSHYVRPRGWYSYRWGVGHRLPPAWYGPAYHVNYGLYGLAPPPYGYRWVRVNDDVLLVAIATGIIADVLTGFYYY